MTSPPSGRNKLDSALASFGESFPPGSKCKDANCQQLETAHSQQYFFNTDVSEMSMHLSETYNKPLANDPETKWNCQMNTEENSLIDICKIL